MLANASNYCKNTVEKDCACASTMFHQRSAEHVFCSFFYRLRSPFLASVSVILQWKAAVSACILEARLEEERRRLAEEVGQGSGCGLVTDCQ
jgi:tryptophan-rich sensory protein